MIHLWIYFALLTILPPARQQVSFWVLRTCGTCRSDGRFCGCDSCCTVRSSSCAGKVDTGRIASAFSSHWHWGPMKSHSASAGVPMRPSRERAPRRQETHPPASLWTAPGDMENSRPLRHCQAMGSPSHCPANQKPRPSPCPRPSWHWTGRWQEAASLPVAGARRPGQDAGR